MERGIIKHCLLLCIFTHIFMYAHAQTIPADALKGVWIYKSYSVGDRYFDNDFASIKIFGDDGKYYSAQVGKLQCGAYKIIPYLYCTYIYRNGEYTECGRKGELTLTSDSTFHGSWMGRIEYWEKAKDFPEELRDYIMEECKKAKLGDPDELQPLIEKHWVNRWK